MSLASGQVLWTFDTGGDVHSSPAIDRAGTVYVGSDGNRVYALEDQGATECGAANCQSCLP